MSFRYKNFKLNQQSGFSLLEMIVVTAIFVTVTGIVLANLPTFRNRASLDLTAQEMALAIREAQVYGTATRVSGDTYPSYGIHFQLTDGPAKDFVLFADANTNKAYDLGADCNKTGQETECLDKYLLDGNFKITDLCVDSVSNCVKTNQIIDVVYTRPFPEPSICDLSGCNHNTAYVIISSPDGSDYRVVAIWNNGQITAENPANQAKTNQP